MTISVALPVQQGRIDITPEEAGYNPKKLDELDRHFREVIEQHDVQAASYLLARGGKVFACRSMGKLREDGAGGDYMPDSLRGIASITKIFTNIAVLQLVEEGKIYLQQPVHTIIQEFDTALHRDIKIRHLLTHTSGLPADPGYFTEPYPRSWRSNISDEVNWIEAMLQGPLVCEPGEAWNYSSSGYGILGEIVARISGMDFHDYLREHIIWPLGLHDTHYKVPEDKLERVCTMGAEEREWISRVADNPYPPRAGGGLFSTVYDLFRLGQLLLNKGTLDGVEILGRKTVETMTTNQLKGVPAFSWGARHKDFPYGLGLHLQRDGLMSPGTFAHEGAGRSALYVDPVEQFVMIYFVPMGKLWVEKAMLSPRNIAWSGIR